MYKQHTNSRGVVAALIISGYSISKGPGDGLVTVHSGVEQCRPAIYILGLGVGSEVEQQTDGGLVPVPSR